MPEKNSQPERAQAKAVLCPLAPQYVEIKELIAFKKDLTELVSILKEFKGAMRIFIILGRMLAWLAKGVLIIVGLYLLVTKGNTTFLTDLFK